MINKKIASAFAVGIVLLFAIILAAIFFLQGKEVQAPVQQVAVSQSIAPTEQIKSDKQDESASSLSPYQEAINWDSIQFDGCGKKNVYEKMHWWKKFSAQIGNYKYYSENYINAQLNAASENVTNTKKIKYTYETYCHDEILKYSVICGEGRSKKLSTDDFNDYGEGCLAKDGSVFVAVFPGEYMGGGNYVFQYDIKGDILKAAQKINESESSYGSSWIDPPGAFGKRINNIIKMTGGSGDAGCSSETEFDYDFVANQIKITKRCTHCESEKPRCDTF